MGSELEAGQRVGNYVISRRIGEGGMGAVYLAEHPQIGRQVAIKVLARHLSQQEGVAERFVAEARAVNRIAHPNIIDIYDFGQTDDGQLYYTMELLQGRELKALLDERGAMAPAAVLPYLEQIGAALQAAHEKGVVHRDLKPENIFLIPAAAEATPAVKVLDFGIAKLLEGDPQGGAVARTSTGMIIGSPLTIAPEQAAGLPDKIDRRTDLYALGVILYWMLAGQPPFAATAPGMLIAQHITASPPPLTAAAPGLPQGLVTLVHRCLEKEPGERPESARAVVEAFAAAIGASLPATVIATGPGAGGVQPPPDVPPTQLQPAAVPPTEIAGGPDRVATTLGGAAAEVVAPPLTEAKGSAGRSKLWIGLGLGTAALVVGGMVVVAAVVSRNHAAEGAAGAAAARAERLAAKVAEAAKGTPAARAPVEPPPAKASPREPAKLAGSGAAPAASPRVAAADAAPAKHPAYGSADGGVSLGGTKLTGVATRNQLLTRYRARLSSRDHYNSRGQRLYSASKILRQDRANFHRYRRRDREDEVDALYHRKEARNDLERRARRIGPSDRRAIVEGEPLIEVHVWTQMTMIRVIPEAAPPMRVR